MVGGDKGGAFKEIHLTPLLLKDMREVNKKTT